MNWSYILYFIVFMGIFVSMNNNTNGVIVAVISIVGLLFVEVVKTFFYERKKYKKIQHILGDFKNASLEAYIGEKAKDKSLFYEKRTKIDDIFNQLSNWTKIINELKSELVLEKANSKKLNDKLNDVKFLVSDLKNENESLKEIIRNIEVPNPSPDMSINLSYPSDESEEM